MDLFVWLGRMFCLAQSAIFSGLTLAFFSVSRLLHGAVGKSVARVVLWSERIYVRAEAEPLLLLPIIPGG